jgi:iron complex outermembrane receptor protein
VICAAVWSSAAVAQEESGGGGEAGAAAGTIQGMVRVLPWDEALPEAVVTVEGTALKATTDLEGKFEIKDVPAGTYRVHVSFPEYRPQVVEVVVAAGQTAAMQAGLTLDEIRGEEIVVVGSKFPEKRLEAPVTVETVGQAELKMVGSSSYLAALSTMKGIDYTDNGVSEKRISARGFNTQFNSRMLFMVDGRLATLPGNGLPQGSLLPTASLDIHAVEVVVGPASALYGANAHTGVVNIVTKTPWDDPGVSVALRGGSQSLLDGSLRVAGTINKDLGYKVNAQLMRGSEWAPDRSQLTHWYGTAARPVFEADLLSSNYDVFSAKAEGYVYYRLGDWNLKGGFGSSLNDGFTLTNAGRNHLRGWQVHYQTAQVSHSNWFAQVTRTVSNAGASYQMERLAGLAAANGGGQQPPATLDMWRDQIKFIDNSELWDSELQYRNEWGGLKVTGGAQARLYRPSSSGTYLADANGVKLQAMELGGYVQADYELLPDLLRVVGAARVDTHSNYALQLSPKGALVYTVARGHHLRAGYNRAFKSPTILENYLLIAGTLLGNRTGFTIKDAAGNVLSEIKPLEPERVDSLEVGYKGSIADRVFVDVVAYHSWYNQFISALTARASPARGQFAFYPDGTPTAQGTAAEGGLSTYSNFGNARVAGADVGVDYSVAPGVSLNGSVSFIRMLQFQNTDPTLRDLLLNVPEWKLRGAVTVQDIGVKNSFLRLSGRYQSAYAFESGRWVSANFFEDGKIPARFVADLAVGYKLQNGLTLSGNVFNLLDDRGVDVLGAPPAGRFAYVQLEYDFTGLDF